MSLALNGTTGVVQSNLATNVANTGPAFSAYSTTSQTLGSNGNKIVFQAEEFDVGSCFDLPSNRFQPNVAGYYQFTAGCYMTMTVTGQGLTVGIFKNGAAVRWGQTVNYPSTRATTGGLFYMNGTTDYVELYAWVGLGGQASATTTSDPTPASVYLNGYLARSA